MKIATLAAAALAGAALVAVLDRTVLAQQQGGITRTILQRADVCGKSNYEAIMAISELPPGGVGDKHRHHGVEVAYVLDGAITIEAEGRSTTYKAGEVIKNDNEAAHGAKNTGSTTARSLAVYVVEKSKPLAEPVK